MLIDWNVVTVNGMFQLKTQHYAECPDSQLCIAAIQTVFGHFQMLYVAVLNPDNPIHVCVKSDHYNWCPPYKVLCNFPRDPKSSNLDLQHKEKRIWVDDLSKQTLVETFGTHQWRNVKLFAEQGLLESR